MKKFLLFFALFLILCTPPCFAMSEEAFYKKLDVITLEAYKLACDILAFNKPAFEAKLTKEEQENGVLWNRICAKDQTLVWGYAKKDKKFAPIYFVTNDPKFTFSGGISVGADIKVLERYFGDTIKNIGIVEGKKIRVGPDIGGTDFIPASVHIICTNGVITEIIFNEEEDLLEGSDVAFSKKAIEFKNKKAKEMGLSSTVRAPEEQAQKKPASVANAVITGDKVNIRTEPSTSSKVVAQLNHGHSVLATKQAKTKNGYWYFIETTTGVQGWVFGKYLRLK